MQVQVSGDNATLTKSRAVDVQSGQIKERPMFAPHGTFSPAQLIGPLGVLFVGLAFWGWMYRDMITNDDLSADEKQNWTFAFILLNIFGAAIYCINVYRNRR
jgi:hypothetical protein